jgi:hypothetical protein
MEEASTKPVFLFNKQHNPIPEIAIILILARHINAVTERAHLQDRDIDGTTTVKKCL